ncbi:hypothetical protein [Algiphilus sp.]|uniref:LA_2478/LA_2722/LA_4182 family protein n=1 Tax=Algiphilus sp. TaxID=1872431 RepID=UPI0032EEFD70
MTGSRFRRSRIVLGLLGAMAAPAAVADAALMAASTAACERVMHCMSEDLIELPEEQRAFFVQALEGACHSFRMQGLDGAQALTPSERELYLACTDSLTRASCDELDLSGAETPSCARFNAAMEQRDG